MSLRIKRLVSVIYSIIKMFVCWIKGVWKNEKLCSFHWEKSGLMKGVTFSFRLRKTKLLCVIWFETLIAVFASSLLLAFDFKIEGMVLVFVRFFVIFTIVSPWFSADQRIFLFLSYSIYIESNGSIQVLFSLVIVWQAII